MENYEEYLNIGLIQTTINSDIAWDETTLTIKNISEMKVWQEIKKGFANLTDLIHPHIVILPELTIPHGYIKNLIKLSNQIKSIVIAGIDFERDGRNHVRNKAIVIVPSHWMGEHGPLRTSFFYFGKMFESSEESDFFRLHGVTFLPETHTYLFDAGQFGKIGLAICSDFYDIERFVIYKGQIHHMIVIAYNKDINSFYFLTEAISRLVYCNVVICNTGHYGGSVAFSPYRGNHERIRYKHEGKNLFTSQVIKLPVFDLDLAQKKMDERRLFKSHPPGYEQVEWIFT